MSEHPPERPTMDDDLAQAYARAQALARDGRAPSAAVRANVLAAAQAVADQAAARRASAAAGPTLAPVAPAVADVGRGRPRALNLSSWRVRAGAAFCAAVLAVGAGWRFDAFRHDDGAVQVASAARAAAEQRGAEAPALPPASREAPAPMLAAAPPPTDDVAPAAEAKAAVPGKDLVVAEADRPQRSQREPRPRLAGRTAAPIDAAGRAADAPVVVAAAASPAPAPAPMAVAQAPAQPPAAMLNATAAPPRVALAAAPAPSTRDERLAAAQAEMAAAPEPVARAKASGGIVVADAARKAAPALAGASLRASPVRLQAAAARGDVETLRALLADPATRVDAPDPDGRTALLHAVLAQRPDAVRLLLAAGADPGRADHAGLTPRQAAQAGASAEIAALLAAPR